MYILIAKLFSQSMYQFTHHQKNVWVCLFLHTFQIPDIVKVFVFSKRIFQSLISTYLSKFYICMATCLFFMWITWFLSSPKIFWICVGVFCGFSGEENAASFTYLFDIHSPSELLLDGWTVLIQQVKIIQWTLWSIFRSDGDLRKYTFCQMCCKNLSLVYYFFCFLPHDILYL